MIANPSGNAMDYPTVSDVGRKPSTAVGIRYVEPSIIFTSESKLMLDA